MPEVLTFNEGSAYGWTGAATASSLLQYVRNVNVDTTITYQKYKPPHATVFTNYPIASAARLAVGQARVQRAMITNYQAATGGGFHFHTFHIAPNINNSAGCWLYSGNIQTMSIVEQTDSEVVINFAAEFPTWSAY